MNRGGVCALGQAALQGLYNPDRIKTPLRRKGDRGSGQFEAISWEEALGEIGASLARIRERNPSGLALLTGSPEGLLSALFRRFAGAVGARPPIFLEAPEAEVERAAARLAYGIDRLPVFDLARSDFILSIGSPFLDRWRSPVHFAAGLAGMRQGRPGRRGKLVQAEARMSATAATADEWLPLVPGSEGLFARAVAGVLLRDRLVGAAGKEMYGRLFDSRPPVPGAVAGDCGIPAERIERVARELASVENPVVIGGGAAAAQSNGLFNMTAVFGLNLLLERLGRPGGIFAPASFGLDTGLDPDSGSETDSGGTSLADFLSRLRQGPADGVEMLIVSEADPVHSRPAGWRLEESFARIGKIVTFASFLDDTAVRSDLVLPLHTDLERVDIIDPYPSVGVPVAGLATPVVEPVVDSRHPGDLLLALARTQGEPAASRFPWRSYTELVETRLREKMARLPGGGDGDFWGFYQRGQKRGGIWGEGALPSAVPAGPSGRAPAYSPARFEGDGGEFPFHLVPFESNRLADGRGANRPWLQELPDPLSTVMWNSWVEIAPIDAARVGARTGDRIRIESATGSIEVGAVVSPAVRPGLVCIPLGGGHVDFGRYARGRGANPLDLVGGMPVDGSGAPAWAATRVRMTRISGGRLPMFGPGLREAESIPRDGRGRIRHGG